MEGADRLNSKVGLQKVYYIDDIMDLVLEYKSFVPVYPVLAMAGRPSIENRRLMTQYHQAMLNLPGILDEFFLRKTREKDRKMEKAMAIQTGVRSKAKKEKDERKKNKTLRKSFFQTCVIEELQHIPLEFVLERESFKAAINISKDGGSKRAWNILKKKLIREWELHQEHHNINEAEKANDASVSSQNAGSSSSSSRMPQPRSNHHVAKRVAVHLDSDGEVEGVLAVPVRQLSLER